LATDLKKELASLEKKIQNNSETLFTEFKNQATEVSEADFHIPDLKIDFAKTLRIKTERM
jgi:hypothetical protein